MSFFLHYILMFVLGAVASSHQTRCVLSWVVLCWVLLQTFAVLWVYLSCFFLECCVELSGIVLCWEQEVSLTHWNSFNEFVFFLNGLGYGRIREVAAVEAAWVIPTAGRRRTLDLTRGGQ